MAEERSRVQVIGLPCPKTWDEYERGCIATFGGGYVAPDEMDAFQHGMTTVFNLLRAEFPEAFVCKAGPQMLAALKEVRCYGSPGTTDDGIDVPYLADAAIAAATGG